MFIGNIGIEDLDCLAREYEGIWQPWQIVPDIDDKEASVVMDISGVFPIVSLFCPLASEEDNGWRQWSVIELENVFYYSNVIDGHIPCICCGDCEK